MSNGCLIKKQDDIHVKYIEHRMMFYGHTFSEEGKKNSKNFSFNDYETAGDKIVVIKKDFEQIVKTINLKFFNKVKHIACENIIYNFLKNGCISIIIEYNINKNFIKNYQEIAGNNFDKINKLLYKDIEKIIKNNCKGYFKVIEETEYGIPKKISNKGSLNVTDTMVYSQHFIFKDYYECLTKLKCEELKQLVEYIKKSEYEDLKQLVKDKEKSEYEDLKQLVEYIKKSKIEDLKQLVGDIEKSKYEEFKKLVGYIEKSKCEELKHLVEYIEKSEYEELKQLVGDIKKSKYEDLKQLAGDIEKSKCEDLKQLIEYIEKLKYEDLKQLVEYIKESEYEDLKQLVKDKEKSKQLVKDIEKSKQLVKDIENIKQLVDDIENIKQLVDDIKNLKQEFIKIKDLKYKPLKFDWGIRYWEEDNCKYQNTKNDKFDFLDTEFLFLSRQVLVNSQIMISTDISKDILFKEEYTKNIDIEDLESFICSYKTFHQINDLMLMDFNEDTKLINSALFKYDNFKDLEKSKNNGEDTILKILKNYETKRNKISNIIIDILLILITTLTLYSVTHDIFQFTDLNIPKEVKTIAENKKEVDDKLPSEVLISKKIIKEKSDNIDHEITIENIIRTDKNEKEQTKTQTLLEIQTVTDNKTNKEIKKTIIESKLDDNSIISFSFNKTLFLVIPTFIIFCIVYYILNKKYKISIINRILGHKKII